MPSLVAPLSLVSLLEKRLSTAFDVAGHAADPVLRSSSRADFQANGALGVARHKGLVPREVAAEVVRLAELDDLCSDVAVASGGFINLTVREDVLGDLVGRLQGDERLGVPVADRLDLVVIDYSGPNVAKEMHVGHLRSTVIGDAATHLLEWLGHTVIRANHLGDWGTPFGMLIEHLLDTAGARAADGLSVVDLDSFYKAARLKFDGSAEFKERSRRRVVALQSGDPKTNRLWRILVEQSQSYFLTVYERLGVSLSEKDFYGESFYNDLLPAVVADLTELGLLIESQGAKCAFPKGFLTRDGLPQPLMVQKSDGGFGYDTTDLAAIRYRTQTLAGTRLLYVVGLPQQQHFEMVFQTAREAGWLPATTSAVHIGFGSVLGTNGRMLRSREGAAVKLVSLIDEAIARANAMIAEKAPDYSASEREAVARAVALGALKYADLQTQRTKDYVFDFDRMLSLEGNTAPYVQYARARIMSILRRADDPASGPATVLISTSEERALAVHLLGFGDVIADVSASLEFHKLTGYLFAVANTFMRFYERVPVLRAEPGLRESRLALCQLTATTIHTGLNILGIEAPDHM
jgi:arginyl-tRNA synthetase